MQYQEGTSSLLNNVMYVPPQTGDVTAAWWCHLGKISLRRSLCRGTASSGQMSSGHRHQCLTLAQVTCVLTIVYGLHGFTAPAPA
ncbi:hypothetical protein T03_5024 [Trichinella britovi]|uniref:Uncharacterized protein n=1 Tax=Trichinella britovi TaxID=45882 RepID=A0A0V1B391_TRIBR|nr:hypothetical protein T03_5024 [Trichinella britovi]